MKKILIACVCFYSLKTFAYKQPVHMFLSEYAATNSVLSSDGLWADWQGKDKIITKDSTFAYQPAKNDFHNAPQFQQPLTYLQLLSYGADSEDTNEGVEKIPYITSRAFNHFYNPQANKKLDISILSNIQANYTSPDWALAGFDAPQILGQKFSYADAQNYFYFAFAAPTAADRNFYMGRMFQSIGNVLHHVQDMAQPEHTRLDPHIDAPLVVAASKLAGFNDSSQYEQFTADLLACGALVTSVDSSFISCPNVKGWNDNWIGKKIYVGGYAAPGFNSPRDYWHNIKSAGLADFSSANFITNDTTFLIDSRGPSVYGGGGVLPIPFIKRLLPFSSDLPLPSGGETDTYLTQEKLVDLLPPGQLGPLEKYKNSKMSFIGIHAKDNFTQQTVDIPRMATYSIFNERMQTFDTSRLASSSFFATNNFNLEQWAAALLPRAVGYSSGLINYFFRIRLSLSEQRNYQAYSGWSIKNISSVDFTGRVDFYFDDTSGVRHFIRSTDNIVIPAGKAYSFYPPDKEGIAVYASANPSTHFYAIAVEKDSNRAVAATAFEYPSPVKSKPASGSSSSAASKNLGCNKVYVSDQPRPYCLDSDGQSKCGGYSIPGGTWGNHTDWTVDMGSVSGDILVIYGIYPSAREAGAKISVYGGVGSGTSYYLPAGQYWSFGSTWIADFYYDASVNTSHLVTISVDKSDPNIPFTVGITCALGTFYDLKTN